MKHLVDLLRNREGRRQASLGFTIVELLIVIVVIAILAAITIVAYNGIQDRANDSSVQSDMRTISKKMELARVDSPQSYYPANNAAIATSAPGIRISRAAYKVAPDVAYNLLFCWTDASVPTDYALLATSKSGKRFYVRGTGNITEYTGATSWADSNLPAICSSVIVGSSPAGAGYSAGDTTTGPFRSWTGV